MLDKPNDIHFCITYARNDYHFAIYQCINFSHLDILLMLNYIYTDIFLSNIQFGNIEIVYNMHGFAYMIVIT